MQDNFESLLTKVNHKLENADYYYISNDPERSLGLEKHLKNFHVIFTENKSYAQQFSDQKIDFLALAEEVENQDELHHSSIKLIKDAKVKEYIANGKFSNKYIQTFKTSSAFAFQVENSGYKLINTSGKLNRLFEDKISQIEILEQLPVNLPNHFIDRLIDLNYAQLAENLGNNFVIQFDRGHTGSGTVFIDDAKSFTELQNTFPNRKVRVSEMIEGKAYTLNACVGENGIYIGGLSYQITGIEGLTPNLGGTIGNDWQYRKDITLGFAGIAKDTQIIGEQMQKAGYKGLFGIDFIVMENGEHKIIEINARQAASIAMYTKIQIEKGQIPLALIHIAEFMEIEYEIDAKTYNQINLSPLPYAQVFIRPYSDMTIKNNTPMGIYQLKGDSLSNNQLIYGTKANSITIDEEKDKVIELVKTAYGIDQIQGQTGFLLLPLPQGTFIKKNGELARIQIKSTALDHNGELFPWIKEILMAINKN